jgi:hypothetical protein
VLGGILLGFDKIAPFLTNPLVLVGFVIFAFYGLLRLILKAGIIPPVAQTTGGQIIKTFLRYGFIVAIVTIVLGFLIEGYKTFVNARVVSDQLNRALNPLALSATYMTTIPLNAPGMSEYLARLQRMAADVVEDYKRLALPASTNSAALGTELTRKQHVYLRTGAADQDGHLVPTSLGLAPDSPLMPDRDRDKVAWALVHNLSLAIFIYRKPIDPKDFKNVFSIGHPPADIGAWILSHNAASYEYSIGSSALTVSFWRLPLPREQYVEYSGAISSKDELRGTQIFVYPNHARPALEGYDEKSINDLLHAITLDSLDLGTGSGSKGTFNIPIGTLPTVTSQWGDPVFVYILPT